jgi:Integrase core domain
MHRTWGTFVARPSIRRPRGKIERWHQTLKNRILLDNYYLPGDLEASIGRFVDHHNRRRYHESLSNLTPADRLLRTRSDNSAGKRKDQTNHNPNSTLAASKESRINSNQMGRSIQ